MRSSTDNLPRLLVLLCLVFLCNAASAQDKIYRKNGKMVLAKVLEVSSSEIKYKEFSNPDGPVYVLEADRIVRIVFENGQEKKFEYSVKDLEQYEGQRSRAIKINFFSPLYGYTEFGYEKSLAVGRSIEGSVGIIGLGRSEEIYYTAQNQVKKRSPAGAFVSFGYKLGKLPSFIIFGKTRQPHLMQGSYLRPTVYLGHYSENYIYQYNTGTSEIRKQQITFGALELELGKQWVFSDVVTLDMYFGLGYGADNKKSLYRSESQTYNGWDNYDAFNYASQRAGTSPGFSSSFGLRVGYLLKNKKDPKASGDATYSN